ncbi:MAG: N-acyl-D-glucosamine 2-epimerase [Bacteroidetes bacterium]|nr:MAG: N-acyl-D-glucosamine 2-epimerase [Bacteroidota bacterium]
MNSYLGRYRKQLREELDGILAFWMQFAPDRENGGFYGSIDNSNHPNPETEKGLVLNARILWTFSAAFNQLKDRKYISIAERAYHYVCDHFIDPEFGGAFWSVDFKGNKLDDRKQTYGIAFCIYGLSEYFRATADESALDLAKDLFEQVEEHAFDKKQKGYIEAFTREWSPISDLRLSQKDANEAKTMNTHLHIVEAYANLYRVWPDRRLKKQIENLLEVFAHYIIDDSTNHMHLFFDENWNVKSRLISYGHEIEAAWLLQEVAEIVRHPGWMVALRSRSVKIAEAAMEGMQADGGLNYESENGKMSDDKHWWPQAEAMVGFFNAYQVTGNLKYLQQSIKTWEFTEKYIKDHENGEWFWGVHADHSLMSGFDKVGFWKCPYHNARACMELIERIDRIYSLED